MPSPRLSVIVPVRNESPNTLGNVTQLAELKDVTEVIVVDCSDWCTSIDVLQELQTRLPTLRVVHTARPGRAHQMNRGYAQARGDIVWFVHADTWVPTTAAEQILKSVTAEPFWGCFDVRFDCSSRRMKLVAYAMNLRSGLTDVCTGDQAIFVSRTLFEKLGGYPEIPIMEDVALTKRLKREAPAKRIKLPVTTSARRWKTHGYLKTILMMWLMRFLFGIGVSPQWLTKLYH